MSSLEFYGKVNSLELYSWLKKQIMIFFLTLSTKPMSCTIPSSSVVGFATDTMNTLTPNSLATMPASSRSSEGQPSRNTTMILGIPFRAPFSKEKNFWAVYFKAFPCFEQKKNTKKWWYIQWWYILGSPSHLKLCRIYIVSTRWSQCSIELVLQEIW